MNNDLISIIAPCYNVGKYLNDFLLSVKNQTYKNYEVILVDDGSNDDTPLILDNFKKDNIKIRIIHQKNRGVSNARNKALEYVNGKYVFMADPDDILHPKALEFMINLIAKSNVEAVICGFKKIKESTKYNEMFFKNPSGDFNLFFDGPDNITAQFLSSNKFNYAPWAKFFKIEILKKIKGFPKVFDEGCTFLEDVPFGVKYFSLTNKVIFNKSIVYYYRKRKGSAIHTSAFSKNKLTAYKGWDVYKSLDKAKFKETQLYINIKYCIDDFYMLFISKGFKDTNTIDKKSIYKRYKSNLKYCIRGKRLQWYIRYLMWTSLPFGFLLSLI